MSIASSLCLHSLFSHFLDYVLIGLLQNGQILEGEIAEVIYNNGLTQSSTPRVSHHMRRNVKGHEATLGRIGLGSDTEECIVRTVL